MVTIHQFNPEIYPVKLWVTITKNGEELQGRFCYLNGKDMDISLLKNNEATVYVIQQKDGERYKGIIIVFTEKKYMSVKTIAHEATHAARFIWDHLGEVFPSEEADAYLVGWVAKCCEIVKDYKKKKDVDKLD
jgi:uncharacterized protein YjaZ